MILCANQTEVACTVVVVGLLTSKALKFKTAAAAAVAAAVYLSFPAIERKERKRRQHLDREKVNIFKSCNISLSK